MSEIDRRTMIGWSVVATGLIGSGCSAAHADPSVEAPVGRVRGQTDGAVDRFLGIPYALPPIGERRFAPAMPHPGWPGLRDATTFGRASAQVFDPAEADIGNFGETRVRRDAIGSEDSLTLNIWRPRERSGPLPVIIYIHGGANWLESSRLPVYDGTNLARDGAIFVSFNYRLGVFGFLDLSPIGGPQSAHSNGLTDQLMAIEWVVRNIAAFGGDPANLTLVGESAGSMDISWLLASGRLPRGVRRLGLLSGIASAAGLGRDGETSAHAPAEGYRRAAAFLADAGFSSMAQLQVADTDEILQRCAAVWRRSKTVLDLDTLFYPRTGAFARLDPFAAVKEGAGAGLDVIIGCTDYEMGLWLLWDDKLDQHPPEWAATLAPSLAARARAALPVLYRGWFPGETEGALGMHMLGDTIFTMPSLWFADLLSAAGARVFSYRFDWQANPRYRAFHSLDLAFLFGHQATPAWSTLIGAATNKADTQVRNNLSRTIRGALQHFARNGNPSLPDQPWPAWGPKREMMLFDRQNRIAADPMQARREWWTANVLPRALGGGS